MQAHVDASTAPGLARCLFQAGASGRFSNNRVGALPPPTLAGAWGCCNWAWVGAFSTLLQAHVDASTTPGWERCCFLVIDLTHYLRPSVSMCLLVEPVVCKQLVVLQLLLIERVAVTAGELAFDLIIQCFILIDDLWVI